MDLETGIYKDDPQFETMVDQLSSNLFQISGNNGRISEYLRRGSHVARGDNIVNIVKENQHLFRQIKPEIESLQQVIDPSPSQKYSKHKLSLDFSELFEEFKDLQIKVINHEQTIQTATHEYDENAIEFEDHEGLAHQHELQFINDDEVFNERLRQDEVSYQQGLISEREQEIEFIAQGMNELNDIFQSLGEIVRDQGFTLDNIENNMYNAASNVYNGSQQLVKAQRWQRATSGRMCCFLIILLVMLVVVILAVSF